MNVGTIIFAAIFAVSITANTSAVTPVSSVSTMETASFCPYFPKMIWDCGPLREIIDEGGRAARTA
jgi:hypothetical protein